MKTVLIAGFVLACLAAAPAGAQSTDADLAHQMEQRLNGAPSNPNLPPVESLSCDQMMAEMSVAGQQMNAQMDPNLATDLMAMQDEAHSRMSGMQAGMMGAGMICAIPGMGLACTAAMNAQMANQLSHVDEDRARREAMVGSVVDSTEGIDLQRMQALSNRFESQHCPMPQAPQ